MAAMNTGLVDLLVRKMSYLNQAQTVHAENVANANTPGYQPLEVAPFSFDNALKQAQSNVALNVTDPRHIYTPVSLAASTQVAVRPKGQNADDAGDIEQESTKVAQTGMEYELVTSVFHKIAGLFKMALKGSSA